MNIILSIYDHNLLHMKFCHDIIGKTGVIALWFSNFHHSVDFIFLSFGIMGFIVELWNY